MKREILLASSAVIALGIASTANAVTVEYKIVGNGAASTPTDFYSGDFTITAIGDTSVDLNPAPEITVYGLSSFTIAFDNQILTSSQAIAIWTNSAANVGGFVQSPGPQILTFPFYMTSPIFATYDLASDLAPTPVSYAGANSPLFTDAGPVTIRQIGGMVFSAQIQNAPAVPEPATWAMMLTGFAMSGAALRYRRRVRFAPAT